MTELTWIIEALEAPMPAPGQALIWVLRRGGPAAKLLLGTLSPTREDLADAAKAREEAGAGRLLRRIFLRALVARLLGRHPDDIRVQRMDGGGLMLPDQGLCASVSGSGAYAAIAVGRQAVGVDIEVPEAGAETPEELCRWTAVEAFVKAMGTGFGEGEYRFSATGKGFALADVSGRRGEGGWLITPAFIAAATILSDDGFTAQARPEQTTKAGRCRI